jgi:hypothetical protein
MTKLTARDLEDAQLLADAKYAKFDQEFNKKFNQPDTDLQNAMAFNAMSDEAKQQLKQVDPEVYKLAQSKYGGQNG